MLVLTFRVAGVLYAVDVGKVVEVVPRVRLREIPRAPGHLAGLLGYRGGAVPVVDLGVLMGGSPGADRLDTRIILAEVVVRGESGRRLVGLIAEAVDDVQAVDESTRAVDGLEIETAPFLGPVFRTEEGLLQLIEPSGVLASMPLAEVAGSGAGA
jgi:chemotaxis-related protein WspB